MDKILQNWENFLNEQTEPYQRKMKAKHSRLKKRVIGHGGQKAGPPYTNKPSMERSKSAPPMGESLDEDQLVIEEHIVKQGKKYCLKSKKSNKNLGCYPTRAGAEKREKQVQYFKHVNEGFMDFFRKKKPEEEQPAIPAPYTDYNEIGNTGIYVGRFPMAKDSKNIRSFQPDVLNKFDKIFLVADEEVDFLRSRQPDILKQYGDTQDNKENKIVATEKRIDDTANPTSEQLSYMEELAVKASNTNGNILIACSAGKNRSSAIAARAIALKQGGVKSDQDLDNIVNMIRSARGSSALAYTHMHKTGASVDKNKPPQHDAFVNFIKNGPTSTLEESLRRVIRRLIREQHGRKRYT